MNQQWAAQQYAAAAGTQAMDTSQYQQGYYDAAGNYHYYDYSQYYAQHATTATSAATTATHSDADSTQSKKYTPYYLQYICPAVICMK